MATTLITQSLPAATTAVHTIRIFRKETKYEFLKLLRAKSFSFSTIGFPVMFYVLFGIANRNGADFFISIHINANGLDTSSRGGITFYHLHDQICQVLASCIQSEIKKVSGLPSLSHGRNVVTGPVAGERRHRSVGVVMILCIDVLPDGCLAALTQFHLC